MNGFMRLAFILLIGLLMKTASAENMFVTDNILIGVHQNPTEESPLLTSIRSGMSVEVLDKDSGFTMVKTADGTQGWISSQYLVSTKPARTELEATERLLQRAQADVKEISTKLAKREKDLQIHRDELANASTSVKELKKRLASAGKTEDNAASEELAKAREEVLKLTARIKVLEESESEVPVDAENLADTVKQLESDNNNLRARIEMAFANLQGEKVPSPEELAAIHPKFPVWYWLLVV